MDAVLIILSATLMVVGLVALGAVTVSSRMQSEQGENEIYIDFLEYRIQKAEEELAEAYETLDDVWNRGRAN